MLPTFLVPETVARESGSGNEWELPATGMILLVTLGITRIIEQESLNVSIWGSSDRADWGAKPLLQFPQKFYCGTYAMVLDLSRSAGVRYLRAEFKLNRWGRGEPQPLFGFYVFAEEAGTGVLTGSAVA